MAPHEVLVPPWAIIACFIVGWVVGPIVALFTTFVGDYNPWGYGFAGWLIVMPLIATRPLKAISLLLGRGG